MKTPKKRHSSHSEDEKQGGASKPVSLAPLTFDEALDGLLAVKPEPKGEPKGTKKQAAKKAVKK